MPLFTARDHARVANGEFTVTYRLWKTPHVKAGTTYAAGFGGAYAVEDVTQVKAREITARDARQAGSPDVKTLLARCAEHSRATITPDTVLYRVQFSFVEDAPTKPALPVDTVLAKVRRMGPWVAPALELIEQNPRTLARILAAEMGMETLVFKEHIRRLKKLGLTVSHPVGYELTETGLACLDALRRG